MREESVVDFVDHGRADVGESFCFLAQAADGFSGLFALGEFVAVRVGDFEVVPDTVAFFGMFRTRNDVSSAVSVANGFLLMVANLRDGAIPRGWIRSREFGMV